MRSIYSLLFLLITLGLSSCSEKKPTLREQSFDEEWLFYRGDIVEGERSDWVELAGIENISMWMQLRKGDVLLSLSMEFI